MKRRARSLSLSLLPWLPSVLPRRPLVSFRQLRVLGDCWHCMESGAWVLGHQQHKVNPIPWPLAPIWWKLLDSPKKCSHGSHPCEGRENHSSGQRWGVKAGQGICKAPVARDELASAAKWKTGKKKKRPTPTWRPRNWAKKILQKGFVFPK